MGWVTRRWLGPASRSGERLGLGVQSGLGRDGVVVGHCGSAAVKQRSGEGALPGPTGCGFLDLRYV